MAAILFIIIIAALFAGSAVLYAMNIHWWRVTLIGGVMFGAVALLWVPGDGDPNNEGFDGYGPADRLKPGIDLAGGTRLVYDVVVPAGQNKKKVIEETKEILADRVDPSGTRGLVWRTVAGQRIEVQMASAPANVRQKREAFDQALIELRKNNLTPAELNAALAKDSPEALKALAGTSDKLLASLNDLQARYKAREAAREAYYAASEAWNRDKKTIPQEQWDEHPAYRKLVELERVYNEEISPDFVELEEDILKANSFDMAQFEKLRAFPPKELTKKEKEEGKTTPRQDWLKKLKDEYPNRAEKLQDAYDALIAYEAVKGPLDGPEDLIALLRGSGVLEFRITADPNEINALSDYLVQLDTQGPRARPTADYRWFEIDSLKQYVPGKGEEQQENIAKVEKWLAQSLSVDADVQDEARAEVMSYFMGSGVIARPYAGRLYVLLHNDEGMAMTRDDVWSVSSVSIGADQLGKPTVNYTLDPKGASLMRDLTEPNIGKPMAVLLDNKVLTDPVIRSQLSDQIQISGDFTQAEVMYLRDTMKAGALEGQLSENPVSQLTIGPSLGADNVRAGLQSALWALVIVAIFMTIYYFFAGIVANFALAANMVLILGVLAMTQATFTLPGIAGLVLTIGMAVDANVLIFERIREELVDRKVSLEVAARQGYGKALSTILDANITTLITCLILGYTATSDVRGFAVVLGVGILATMFTALFCTKVFIDLWIRYRKPKTLEMLPTLVPAIHRFFSPNVNWIAKAKYLVPLSAILLVLGLGEAIFQRGEDMLDIEFRSGTSVGFTLKPTGEVNDAGKQVLTEMNIGDARKRIAEIATVAKEAQAAIEANKAFEPKDDRQREIAAAVQDAYKRHEAEMANYEAVLASGGKKEKPDPVPSFALLDEVQVVTTGSSGENREVASGFNIATLITDSEAVTALLKVAFKDVLETTNKVNFAGEDLTAEAAQGIVQPMKSGVIGRAFGDSLPGSAGEVNVPDFAGGVAIYLRDMTPALSVEELTERIERMRRQPPHDELGVRSFKVVGVARADGKFDARDNQQYTSVVVVANDNGQTDYSTADGAQSFTDAGGLADTEWKLVKDAMRRDSSFTNVTVFNGQVSGTMQQQAIVAIGLSLLAVVIYIWIRFGSFRYGLAAIAALVHDVAVALGLIALAGLAYSKFPDSAVVKLLMLDPFKVNIAMIAAFLTIIGYSLNDTIVVFDRIRENRGRLSRATPQIINDSINQTISRTVLTSGTTLIAVATLYFLGGPGVHGFAFAMLVGIIVGTYSSVAIAAPILLIGTKGKGPTGGPQEARPAKPAEDELDIVSEPATA